MRPSKTFCLSQKSVGRALAITAVGSVVEKAAGLAFSWAKFAKRGRAVSVISEKEVPASFIQVGVVVHRRAVVIFGALFDVALPLARAKGIHPRYAGCTVLETVRRAWKQQNVLCGLSSFVFFSVLVV